MARYFSPSTGGLYWDLVNGKNIPADAVEFPEERLQTICGWLGEQKKLAVDQDGTLFAIDPDPVVLTPEQLAAVERAWRDKEVDRVAWLRDRHRDQLDVGIDTTLDADRFAELLAYIQELRDWPQSPGFPDQAYRPVATDWLLGQTV